MIRFPVLALSALIGVAGCNATLPLSDMQEPQVTRSFEPGPPGAKPGTCWGKHTTPAVIETVTQQIMLQPAQIRSDGTVRDAQFIEVAYVSDVQGHGAQDEL